MQNSSSPSLFWSWWLLVVSINVIAFGITMVLAPGLARAGFSWLIYADPQRLAGFGAEALAYVSLLHAVLGALMVGWGVALVLVVRGLFFRGERVGWQIVAVSVAAWFVPDTAFSLWSGFWPNAVLNTVFIVLFALPLAATYRSFHEEKVSA